MDFIPNTFRKNGREPIRSVEDGMSGSTLQVPPAQMQSMSRRATIFEVNDQLSAFRHMVGIHSTRSFAASTAAPGGAHVPDLSHNNLHFDGRAAPNLGIYNRVCHREAQAKRGYKLASVLINSCLGVQVIVAAALTAMGAANSNHVGITAFGAINTVIAGLLTYLKGSGLPNRIRYYENEWKKVREFIEQRERDFSRPDCKLDLNEVVRAIEAMYEEVKADVQTNVPDNYISVSDIRNRSAAATNPQIPNLNSLISGFGAKNGKVKELEMKYGHKITEFLEGLAQKEEERLKIMEKGLEDAKSKVLQGSKELERDVDEKSARLGGLEKDIERNIERTGDDIQMIGREIRGGMQGGERAGENLDRK